MKRGNILVVNAFVTDRLADSFEQAIRRPLGKVSSNHHSLRLLDLETVPDPGPFSHLIVSGSEASILERQPWDDLLADIIHRFVDGGRRVLGICYGHQFMANALSRKPSCRPSPTPEFGWKHVEVVPNPLFNGIERPLCMVSHYDEVHDLGADFKIIASTRQCRIHGFQYRDLPVWGLQYHPEYNIQETDEIYNLLAQSDTMLPSRLKENPHQPTPIHLRQNESVLINFCSPV